MKSKNLLEIDVQGVVPEKQCIAKKELQNIFKKCYRILEGVPIKVLITKKFDQTVDKLLKEKLKVKYQYSSKRHKVVAVAKTIPYSINDSIGFILLFNSFVFGNWEKEQWLERFMLISHEANHIIDNLKFYHFLGAESFFYEPKKTKEIMFKLAHDIWMDYNAERFLIDKLEEAVKGLDPRATITYKSHEEYIKSFKELLIDIPKLLTKEINDYKNVKTSINDLWPKAYFGVRELLIAAAYTTAHSDALNKKYEQIEEMEKDEQYSLFFQRWEIIHKKLQLLYESRDKFDNNILRDISYELLSLFKIYGFTLSDVENGIYVAV